MLIWKKLVEDARRSRIDRDEERAREWMRQHLPELFLWPADEEGHPLLDESGRRYSEERGWKWSEEWPKWQDNFQALLWLVGRKEKVPKKRTTQDIIPLWVSRVLDRYLSRIRVAVLTDYYSELELKLALSGDFNVVNRFANPDEFWEAVFLTFFRPSELSRGSVCSDCGKSIEPTKRLKKVSRATRCGACRVKKWRKDHPEEAREMWRESKRQERERAKRPPARPGDGMGTVRAGVAEEHDRRGRPGLGRP